MANSREFGKRSLDAQVLADARAVEAQAEAGASNGKITKYMGEIIVIGAATFGLVYLGLTFATRPAPPAEAASAPLIELAATPEIRASAANYNLQEIERSCNQVTKNIKRESEFDGIARIGAGGFTLSGLENAVLSSSAYANCLMNTEPSRLCQSEHRQHLVSAVNTYVSSVKSARVVGKLADGAISYGEEQLNRNPNSRLVVNQFETHNKAQLKASAASSSYDTRFISNLRRLAGLGLIKASDFGGLWGISLPEEMTKVLEGVKVLKQACQS